MAIDVAHQIVSVLQGEPAPYAVNAPMLPAETMSMVGPFAPVAEMVASIATQVSEGQLRSVEIDYTGELALHDTTLLRASVIRGLLKPVVEGNITVVNANLVAEQRGLHIVERKARESEGGDGNLLTVRLVTAHGTTTISGAVEHGQPHLVALNDLRVDLTPSAGVLLLCEHQDQPGRIGAVGTKLGEMDINIASMKVGRAAVRGRAVMVLELDDEPTEEQVQAISAIPGIGAARLVRL